MGRRGPAPEPSAAKVRRGITDPAHNVNYEAPVPRPSDPVMPKGMDDIAQAVWKHVIREMGPSGIILGADRDILRAYCETVARYTSYTETLNGTGPLVQGARHRELIINPMQRLVEKEREAMRLLSRELGLSPAARANMRIDPTERRGTSMDDVLGPPPRLRLVGTKVASA